MRTQIGLLFLLLCACRLFAQPDVVVDPKIKKDKAPVPATKPKPPIVDAQVTVNVKWEGQGAVQINIIDAISNVETSFFTNPGETKPVKLVAGNGYRISIKTAEQTYHYDNFYVPAKGSNNLTIWLESNPLTYSSIKFIVVIRSELVADAAKTESVKLAEEKKQARIRDSLQQLDRFNELRNIGMNKYEAGDCVGATTYFQQALNIKSDAEITSMMAGCESHKAAITTGKLIARADSFDRAGFYEIALTIYRVAETKSPGILIQTNSWVTFSEKYYTSQIAIGDSLAGVGSCEGAALYYDKALDIRPKDPLAQMKKKQCVEHKLQNMIEAANSAFRREDCSLAIYTAELILQIDSTTETRSKIRSCLECNSTYRKKYLNEGNKLLDSLKFNEALSSFENAAYFDTSSIEIFQKISSCKMGILYKQLVWNGDSLSEAGNYSEAITSYQLATKNIWAQPHLDDKIKSLQVLAFQLRVDGYVRNGDSLFRKHKYESARTSYSTAWQMLPDEPGLSEKIRVCSYRINRDTSMQLHRKGDFLNSKTHFQTTLGFATSRKDSLFCNKKLRYIERQGRLDRRTWYAGMDFGMVSYSALANSRKEDLSIVHEAISESTYDSLGITSIFPSDDQLTESFVYKITLSFQRANWNLRPWLSASYNYYGVRLGKVGYKPVPDDPKIHYTIKTSYFSNDIQLSSGVSYQWNWHNTLINVIGVGLAAEYSLYRSKNIYSERIQNEGQVWWNNSDYARFEEQRFSDESYSVLIGGVFVYRICYFPFGNRGSIFRNIGLSGSCDFAVQNVMGKSFIEYRLESQGGFVVRF